MASAAELYATESNVDEQSSREILRIGNLRFCQGCRNLMYARAAGDRLSWKCSIDCAFNQEINAQRKDDATISDRLVVLSQTTDNDFSHSQNPHNEFTRYDPSLLRTMKVCPNKMAPEHQADPDRPSEMIIFKQNLVTANSYYICTVCNHNISLDDKLIV